MDKRWWVFGTLVVTLAGYLFTFYPAYTPVVAAVGGECAGTFYSVSLPLNDLGASEYLRINGDPPTEPPTPTGVDGGLYPGGVNTRPATHEAAGMALAENIVPLNNAGEPATDGRIVMISIGMSNTAQEFQEFVTLANADPDLHPLLAIVNGAQPGQTSDDWADPAAPAWDVVDQRLISGFLSPAQVQIAWVKLAQTGTGGFPAKAQALQADLEAVAQNLKTRYPNIKLAYLSSRTRSYTYWQGLSPEPVAFETGFAVRWLIEQQLNGDPDLNYDPASGPAVAPWLAWGPYLWIDGLNPRSDGRVWLPEDLAPDCTHPSPGGELKVADMLLDFFKSDATTAPWFLADGVPISPYEIYLPILLKE